MPVWSIDREKCIGCGTCIESCPMDVFRLDTLVSDREECAPCKLACPLGVNPREYHNLIKMDLMDEAARLLARDHSMPVITGWLCPHPCETECSRNEVDTPVNINGLEQYLGERLLNLEPILPEQNNKGGVAIIGSGPAGLSAAYHLSSIGYQVTVYEKEAKVGGLLRTAIPTFRLPEEVLDKQIAVYEKMGIKFETYAEHRIRGTILDELRKMDWIPRSVRKDIHRIEEAMIVVRSKLGREAEDVEVAQEMGIDIDAYHKMLSRARGIGLLSLDEIMPDGSTPPFARQASDGPSAFDDLKIKETKEVIAKALLGLSRKEQLVISLYYYDELTLKEIAEVLDLTESRISQIHSKAILRLRAKLKSYQEG